MSKFGTVKVAGGSMLPAYRDGDWLLVSWIHKVPSVETIDNALIGKVVVIEQESRPGIYLIKRVRKFDSGKYWVEGDGAGSADSRNWGWLEAKEIIGVVLFRYFRKKQKP